MMETDTLRHNSKEHQYELDVNGHIAFIEYTKTGDKSLCLTHTYVPQQLSGQGVGKRLVAALLERMKREEISIVPQCEFIAQYILRNPQWEQIVVGEIEAKK